MTESSDDGDNRRQAARRARRDAGTSSAKLANELMQVPASSLPKLGLDEDLLGTLEAARRITSHTARRRAERTLAGALRRVDIDALAARLESVRSTGVADSRRLHLAEQWRTRLLDEPDAPAAFAAAHPAADAALLERLIESARLERTTGKPPGAGRALFRHVTHTIERAAQQAAADAELAEATDAGEPGDG
jgi:ribosome-associated protein